MRLTCDYKIRLVLNLLSGRLVMRKQDMWISWQPVGLEIQRNRTNAGGERSGFAADAYEPSSVGPDVVKGGFEFPGIVDIGGAIGLDFNGNAAIPPVENKVGFLTGGGAPEIELGEGMGQAFAANDVLNDKTLPTRAPKRVIVEVLRTRDIEQVMEQASIAEINALGFDQALSDVAEKRRQKADEKDSFQQV